MSLLYCFALPLLISGLPYSLGYLLSLPLVLPCSFPVPLASNSSHTGPSGPSRPSEPSSLSYRSLNCWWISLENSFFQHYFTPIYLLGPHSAVICSGKVSEAQKSKVKHSFCVFCSISSLCHVAFSFPVVLFISPTRQQSHWRKELWFTLVSTLPTTSLHWASTQLM